MPLPFDPPAPFTHTHKETTRTWISATAVTPAAARPMPKPTSPCSLSGVLNTRAGPKRSCSPTVARKTPPKATSSPNTHAVSSASKATCSASLTAAQRLSGRAAPAAAAGWSEEALALLPLAAAGCGALSVALRALACSRRRGGRLLVKMLLLLLAAAAAAKVRCSVGRMAPETLLAVGLSSRCAAPRVDAARADPADEASADVDVDAAAPTMLLPLLLAPRACCCATAWASAGHMEELVPRACRIPAADRGSMCVCSAVAL